MASHDAVEMFGRNVRVGMIALQLFEPVTNGRAALVQRLGPFRRIGKGRAFGPGEILGQVGIAADLAEADGQRVVELLLAHEQDRRTNGRGDVAAFGAETGGPKRLFQIVCRAKGRHDRGVMDDFVPWRNRPLARCSHVPLPVSSSKVLKSEGNGVNHSQEP